MTTRWLAVLVALACAVVPAFAQEIPKTNCDLRDYAYRMAVERRQKIEPGPFRLAAMHCQFQLQSSGSRSPVAISPDITSVAAVNERTREVEIARLSSATAETTYSSDFGAVGSGVVGGHRGSLRWSADSKTLWSATQNVMRPTGGGALGPVRPLRIDNGLISELPEVHHDAGLLDGLMWTDDGRALALIGARGNYYRPAITNPNPSLAFIDAVSGRVIETAALRSFLTPDPDRVLYPALLIGAAEVVRLRDGRMRAFIAMSRPASATTSPTQTWIVWTEGESPRQMPSPYSPADRIATAMSADGDRLLVVRPLRVDFTCPRAITSAAGCITGSPVEGTFAALHDLETGRELWAYRVRLTVPSALGAYRKPELSDDGRYALIGLPADDAVRYSIALLDTRDGSVEQLFPVEEGGNLTFGFGRGSRRMWINISGVTTVYELR